MACLFYSIREIHSLFFLVHLNHICFFSFSLKKYKVKKSFLTDTYNSLLSKVIYIYIHTHMALKKKIDL